jgi:DNA-binding winged helix-turn-helix (wHTH) protein
MQLPPIEPAERRPDEIPMAWGQPGPAENGVMLEFGRFRVLLRQRQLLADGAPVALGTRAFDLLMVLLEANGSLVTKDELLRLVWPGIVVSNDNLKVQISTLRRALGADKDIIRTEVGRGYRFTAAFSSIASGNACRRPRWMHRSAQRPPHKWTVRCSLDHGFDGRKCSRDGGARSHSARQRLTP